MTASKLFDFLGRVLMAAVFVNALPAKFTNFAETAGFIASKGCLLYTSPSPRD